MKIIHSTRTFFSRLIFVFTLKISECPDDREFEIFSSPIDCKSAVEYYSSSKISQIRMKFGFFRKKKLKFFRIGKGGKFAVECGSNDVFLEHFFLHNCEVFVQKIQFFLNLEKLENLI